MAAVILSTATKRFTKLTASWSMRSLVRVDLSTGQHQGINLRRVSF
jgi:hypothetical protein